MIRVSHIFIYPPQFYADKNSCQIAKKNPLQELPQGYDLWVCHRYHKDTLNINGEIFKPAKLNEEDKPKYHRRDYYIYGHKNGCFRSHADVLPHLLYLAFDSTDLHANCVCLLCAGDKLSNDINNAGGAKDSKNQKRKEQTWSNIEHAGERRDGKHNPSRDVCLIIRLTSLQLQLLRSSANPRRESSI